MVKVLFNKTCVVKDGTGTTFTAGEVYDLPVSSADRWKRRGVAVDAPVVTVVSPEPEPDNQNEWYKPGSLVWSSSKANDEYAPVTIEADVEEPAKEPAITKRRGRPPKVRTE